MQKSEICYHSVYGILVRNPNTKYFCVKSDDYVRDIPVEKKTFVSEADVTDKMVRVNRRQEKYVKKVQCEECEGYFKKKYTDTYRNKRLCRDCMINYDGVEQLDVCNQLPIGGMGAKYHVHAGT